MKMWGFFFALNLASSLDVRYPDPDFEPCCEVLDVKQRGKMAS